MAQINVTLNENKSIKQYSNSSFDGSKLVKIDDDKVASLPEYYELMWVDDDNLVHAENLPTTKYEDSLNKINADIENDRQAIDTKVQQANNAIAQLTIAQAQFDKTAQDLTTKAAEANDANAQLDTKIKSLNNMIGALTAEIAAAKAATK